MSDRPYDYLVGIDWAPDAHQAVIMNPSGEVLAQRAIKHTGAEIASFISGLLERAGGDADRVAVAIETPRGGLVEMLVERKLHVYYLNPKQLDRFRDRHSVAGAKSDELDSYVLADSLRTDLRLFRRVKIDEPLIIQLREFSRMRDDLQEELGRLANRLREQVHRFFPQMLELCPAANESWFWALLERIPTPADAKRTRVSALSKLLRKHRIRRFSAEELLDRLRVPAVEVAEGTVEAALTHVRILIPRLRLVQTQLKENDRRIERLLERIGREDDDGEGEKSEHRDVDIILSMPGIGMATAATMLGEAAQALAARDREALRKQSGVAPVTRKSGKRTFRVVRRQARNARLAEAMFHAARVHAQTDPHARQLYAALRSRGHSHGRALRTIGERMLRILAAMLRDGTLYDAAKCRREHPGSALPAAA